jgi:hypothetical protein
VSINKDQAKGRVEEAEGSAVHNIVWAGAREHELATPN